MTQDLDTTARTARWTAAARARESERKDRLFDDSYARVLAGDEGFALLDAEPAEAAGNPFLSIRTRFFDRCVGSRRKVSGRSSLLPLAWTHGRSGWHGRRALRSGNWSVRVCSP